MAQHSVRDSGGGGNKKLTAYIPRLRNPSDKEQSYYLDLTKNVEIPSGEVTSFTLKTVYGTNATLPFDYSKPVIITLKPLETLVIEATPMTNKK